MSIELIRKINKLEQRIDELIKPEITSISGDPTATIKISFKDFVAILGADMFPTNDDVIGLNYYPYTGSRSGNTITVRWYWTVKSTPTTDVVLQCGIEIQSEGDVVSSTPFANISEKIEQTASTSEELVITTFTFVQAYAPEDMLDISFKRLGTDYDDTCDDTVRMLSASIIFS